MRGLTVLVHGATGGVGSIATQMAVRDGATVIATGRDDTQLDAARALGAHHTFLADTADLAAQVRSIAPNGLSEALVDGSLRIGVSERLPLEDVARGHELVEGGHAGRVILVPA